jgi:hypothetical protein
MNRWIERAILLNLIMLILFLYAEYSSFMTITEGLSEISRYSSSGNVTGLQVTGRFEWTFQRIYIDFEYSAEGWGQGGQRVTGSTPYFSILLFIITVILNLLLIWRMTYEKKEPQ